MSDDAAVVLTPSADIIEIVLARDLGTSRAS